MPDCFSYWLTLQSLSAWSGIMFTERLNSEELHQHLAMWHWLLHNWYAATQMDRLQSSHSHNRFIIVNIYCSAFILSFMRFFVNKRLFLCILSLLFWWTLTTNSWPITPALRHDQVPKKESSKPSMNLRPQVHPHTRNSWQNLWRLRKKWFFFTFDQKMGQKVLKMGFKCLGLVWYVFVWLGCDQNWSELKNRIQLCLL